MKPVDLEAQMKRKLNRRRKEFQMCLHKVNLIAWVAHGNFVNRKVNDTKLMSNALQLLPKNNNHCYPTDKTDIDYFKQITNWFRSTIKLNNKDMYCMLQKRPPIMMSLALQMKFKAAICRRDYVLIFVILLRAIGIQCRIVQSLNCAPIMPPKSDLLSLAKKPEEKSKENGNSKSGGSKSSRSKSKPQKSSSSHKKSPEKSSRSSRSKMKKPVIPQLDGGDDLPRGSKKPQKLKLDLGKDDSSTGTKMAPRVRFSLDSPNRAKSPSEKLFKDNKASGSKSVIKKIQENEALKAISPRKTRSKATVVSEKKIESNKKENGERSANTSKHNDEKASKSSASKPKVTLQVFSPRRLRSRSRSNEGETPKDIKSTSSPSTSKSPGKPNLKNLQNLNDRKRPSTSKENEFDAKKLKVTGTKRAADESINDKGKKVKVADEMSEDSDSSAKYFKTPHPKKKTKSSVSAEVIDRRVLSSDDDADSAPQQSEPKKNKRIDIWVEVYSEKDERWVTIDVLKNKVDCIPDITKAATSPMIYVFAWNNDNSLKDVSHRYCPNLNTVTRKQRVDVKYLETVIGPFAGQKTARDVKEDDELNRLQLKIPMPTSIGQ